MPETDYGRRRRDCGAPKAVNRIKKYCLLSESESKRGFQDLGIFRAKENSPNLRAEKLCDFFLKYSMKNFRCIVLVILISFK